MSAVVEALVAAFNRRDRAAVAALLDDDVVCIGASLPPARGKAATMALLDPFLAAEAADWRIVNMAVNGSVVFTERVDRFRFPGKDWIAVPAAGVFEIGANGLITAWRDYFDLAEIQGALS